MSSLENVAGAYPAAPDRTSLPWQRVYSPIRWLGKQHLSLLIPAGLLVAVVLASITASVLAPFDPNALNMQQMLAAPSLEHPLGTDQLGRDVLSRILYGGRTTIIMSLIGTAAIIGIGLVIGLTTGYVGGRFDLVVSTLLTVLLGAKPAPHSRHPWNSWSWHRDAADRPHWRRMGRACPNLPILSFGTPRKHLCRSGRIDRRRTGPHPLAPHLAQFAHNRRSHGNARSRSIDPDRNEFEFPRVGSTTAQCRLGNHAQRSPNLFRAVSNPRHRTRSLYHAGRPIVQPGR